ncbi:MAG: hypothetical protein V4560_18220 [Bacteroidota bacterium]
MANFNRSITLKIFVFAIVLQYTLPVHAQLLNNQYKSKFFLTSNNSVSAALADTTVTADKENTTLSYSALPAPKTSKLVDDELLHLNNTEASISKPHERKQLMSYLKTITSNTNEEISYNQSHTRFLYGVANVFAKLRLYPLAMKIFLKTTTVRVKKTADTLNQADYDDSLPVTAIDDSLVARQALLANIADFNKKKSKVTNYKYIMSTLDDGKKAVAYAMLFHVKQPVPGKRKIFVWGNTGHTFITLIKYNVDSTYSSFSFGFYPNKQNPLSATPVLPATASVFRDDTNHQWDEVLGKFISKRRFDKILQLVKQYDHLEYHLSNNNCTDFGLKAAQLAGISIDGTTGSWPLGHGNNPAITGQSILEKKFTDADTGKPSDLFVNTIVTP